MHTRIIPAVKMLSIAFRRFWIDILALALTCLFALGQSLAQQEQGFTVSSSVGFSPLVGDISTRLNKGWHIAIDGGDDFTSHFSTTLEYMHNGYGVSRRVLDEAQVPDGNAHLWAITLNPKLRLNRKRSGFDPYVVGGVGYYRRTMSSPDP
jgi:hypothetical protein